MLWALRQLGLIPQESPPSSSPKMPPVVQEADITPSNLPQKSGPHKSANAWERV